MIDRETAIRRLRACLRLAQSSEPHEAATALRHAQALMAEYGLNQADAEESPYDRRQHETRYGRDGLPNFISRLADTVARAFGCRVIGNFTCRNFHIRATVDFVGPRSQVEIAEYAFTVLRRQLEAQMRQHTRRIRKRGNKTKRGAAFALGWVHGVAQKLDAQPLSIEQEAAIDKFVKVAIGETENVKARDLTDKRSFSSDLWAGHAAGRSAELHDGLAGTGPKRIVVEGSP